MSAIEKLSHTSHMSFSLRPLKEQDIAQAVEIERDAFPTLFPPTSFRRELKNHRARYLVAWQRDDGQDESGTSFPQDAPPEGRSQHSISRLLSSARGLWPRRHSVWEPGQQYLAGFIGTWYMVDEAHIVAVGVRGEYRGRGIGELLLIGAIEQAMERRIETVTLEVRVSNSVAQNLYAKYGFKNRGVRKGYYSDNREDAFIMTTDSIHTPDYAREFYRLVQAHELRWGHAERVLS